MSTYSKLNAWAQKRPQSYLTTWELYPDNLTPYPLQVLNQFIIVLRQLKVYWRWIRFCIKWFHSQRKSSLLLKKKTVGAIGVWVRVHKQCHFLVACTPSRGPYDRFSLWNRHPPENIQFRQWNLLRSLLTLQIVLSLVLLPNRIHTLRFCVVCEFSLFQISPLMCRTRNFSHIYSTQLLRSTHKS